MIMSMVNLELELRSVLLVIIEKDNLERMQKADPVTLESFARGGGLQYPAFPRNLSVLIAYEEDQPKLYELAKAANKDAEGVMALFKYLERGREFIEGKDGMKHIKRA
jgi:hypothetical protein